MERDYQRTGRLLQLTPKEVKYLKTQHDGRLTLAPRTTLSYGLRGHAAWLVWKVRVKEL